MHLRTSFIAVTISSLAFAAGFAACSGGSSEPVTPEASSSASSEPVPGAETSAPTAPSAPSASASASSAPVLTSIEPTGSAPVGEAPPPLSKDAIKAIGSKCPDHKCATGLTCVEYFGIAGPSGPKFSSCEVKCGGSACPSGLKCVTIADGPGAVCRP